MTKAYLYLIKKNILFKGKGLLITLFFFVPFIGIPSATDTHKIFIIDQNSPSYITHGTWEVAPTGGDTIFIASGRTRALKFKQINGEKNNPLTLINDGGQVQINDTDSWGAITFEDCTHIKISGQGHSGFKYGFKLAAKSSGLAFSGISSDCEAEFIHIDHEGFFGIVAKKDYGGNPPSPAPVFFNLVIHDCFIENVTEGMYLGETKSPGMEFKHVKIYNNIVRNTGREAIQIANMVEDVEIYNNTMLNAGVNGDIYHGNLLQIGDNSVASVYNNILIGANSYGIISFGMGNNYYTNNYISNSKGLFADNRLFTVIGSPITVSDNYFSNIKGEEVIKNMNEVNLLEINNNEWDTDNSFYNNASGNDNNFALSNNLNQPVDTILFSNPAENDYSLAPETPEKYKNLGAPGGPLFTDYEETSPEENNPVEPQQIELTAGMILDEVEGGSYHTPGYLVDEQNCTPGNEQNPVSESWKPHWNMEKGPYNVTIDLQEFFHVSCIALHDMHDVKNLEVSMGEPGNWELLFTETCDQYKTWKLHTTDIETRYIRLSMRKSVYAAVNEIIIYGNPLSGFYHEKSASLNTQDLTVSNYQMELETTKINLYPNPAVNQIKLNVPETLNEDFKVEIFNVRGQLAFTKKFISSFQNQVTINLSAISLRDGVYFLKYSNKNGVSKTRKFIKNEYLKN
jgi:hypothetical protein